jgi:hypothetical protein
MGIGILLLQTSGFSIFIYMKYSKFLGSKQLLHAGGALPSKLAVTFSILLALEV